MLASATARIGGLSKIMTSARSASSPNRSRKGSESRSSAGFGGNVPEVTSRNPSTAVGFSISSTAATVDESVRQARPDLKAEELMQ